jgi:hypothetical protein
MEGKKLYGKVGYDEASKMFVNEDIQDMSQKVVALTGANSGIGYAAALSLAKLNAEVHLVCRNAGN